jgi:hypothetical protein
MPADPAVRPLHPEAVGDEIFICNVWKCDFPAVGWNSKRLGSVAYSTAAAVLKALRPVFVQKSEIEAAGVDIPVRGAIDPRW